MLGKLFKPKYTPLNKLAKAMFGAQTAPKGRLMVKDTFIWLNCINGKGQIQRVAAYENESLYTALIRSNVPGVPVGCGGGDQESKPHELPHDFYGLGPLCDTCQVILPDEYFDQIPMSSAEEKKLLGSIEEVTKNHRLS